MNTKDSWRYKLYKLIEVGNIDEDGTVHFDFYDFFMIIVIVISLLPLAFKQEPHWLIQLDVATAVIFIIDYFLRWITADYKFNSKSFFSFIRYPFSFMAVIDLLAVIPSLTAFGNIFRFLELLKQFKAFRIMRTLKIIRIIKAARYSKSISIISSVLKESRQALLAVCTLAIAYILVSALIVFNVEPDTFESFFDAVYWATVSLTTVGYGDIYPVSTAGRIVTMISSLFGIAIVALPAGIITAGYMDVISK